jgi:DNA processing protein
MSSLETNELQYWVAFNQLPEFGPKRFSKILNYFPSLAEAWSANKGELIKSSLEAKVIDKFLSERSSIEPEQELEKVVQAGLQVITIKDENYPKNLKEIHNPPPLLYASGELFNPADEFSLGVVGTRKITPYGQQVTEDIVRALTQSGLSIVSGLALGIDALAHKTCLQNKGRTIAVLGNGLDNIYPSSNIPLSRRILDTGGIIISEFPLGTPSYRSNFPHRNRIISGLTLGTLVVEADIKSGSLITAQAALEQNREVFAVPGPIYAISSKGPNQLIKQGAVLVTNAQDILQTLNLQQIPEIVKTRNISPDTAEEKQIIELLKTANRSTDEFIKLTKLDAGKINSILTGMELKGMVRNIGSNTYTLAR